MTSSYDGQVGGNILVIGRTSCGKTTFLEKLGINKLFGELLKTEWISGIDTDKKGKAKIQSCFSNEMKVHLAKKPVGLELLIETFKLRTHDILDENDANSLFGENKKMDCLIVMDDVSGVADISESFENFLRVSRKFGFHCVYVFHVIALATQNWQKIISQTNIFDIFPASVPQNTFVFCNQKNMSQYVLCDLIVFLLI